MQSLLRLFKAFQHLMLRFMRRLQVEAQDDGRNMKNVRDAEVLQTVQSCHRNGKSKTLLAKTFPEQEHVDLI